METCSTAGCERPVRNKRYQLCKNCNHRRLNAGTECIYEGCTKPVKSRGLCNTHHPSWLNGKIQVEVPEIAKSRRPAPVQKYSRICVRWGCGRVATYGEFCRSHKEDQRFSHSANCRVEGCLRPATFIPGTGFCVEHGVAA